MKISLICVGKIKEKYLTMGIEEYKKRLGRYCSLEIIELPDEKIPENAGTAEEEAVKKTEGARILKALKDDSYCIALDIRGQMLSSEEVASHMEKLFVSGKSNISFVIGGSLGLSDEVLKRADYRLSFSKMTFPHQLMRLIFLEQLYRVFKIMNNEAYHK